MPKSVVKKTVVKKTPPVRPSPRPAQPDLNFTSPPPASITRAISICQPWAWAITDPVAGKSVENRTWQTNYRGWVVIHASTSRQHMTAENDIALCELHPDIERELNSDRADLPGCNSFLARKEKRDWHPDAIFHAGAYVGAAEIIDCLELPDHGDLEEAIADLTDAARRDALMAWWQQHKIPPGAWASGPHCFLLANQIRFPRPIPAKGALNIFYIPPDLQDAVAAQLTAVRQG